MRIAVVGCGNICNLAHIPAWKNIKDREIVATCDIAKGRAEKARRLLGAKTSTTDFGDILGMGVDAVDLCVPTHKHADLAVEALEHGTDVVCEKPMANNMGEADRMVRAARKSGSRLFIAHVRRFDRRWTRIRESLRGIGDLRYMRRSERGYLPFRKSSWYWDAGKGGTVLTDVGVHCTDFANWYLGGKPRQVLAQGMFISKEARESGCFDFSSMLLEYGNQKSAYIDVAWSYPRSYSALYSSLDVIGTKGRIAYSDRDSNPAMSAGDGITLPRYSPLLSSDIESFKSQLSHFLDCMRRDREPRVGVRDAYNALLLCRLGLESIRKDKPVRVKGTL